MAFGKKIEREDLWVFLTVLAVNAVAAYLLVGLVGQASSEALVRTRIGEDLLRVATVGRQGLVCSVRFAPLPTLLLLPFLVVPWNALHVAAPHLLSAAFSALTATYLNKILRGFSLGAIRFVLFLLFVLNPMVLVYSADGSSQIIFVGFMIAAIHYLLQWVESCALRDLALLAVMTTLSAITHQMGALLSLVVIAIVTWKVARNRSGWHKGEGTILIALFPMLYVAALWHLTNWLIMGDALYFLRGTYLGSTSAGAASVGKNPSYAMTALILFGCLFVGRLLRALSKWRLGWRSVAESAVAICAVALLIYNLGWSSQCSTARQQFLAALQTTPTPQPSPKPFADEVKDWVMERSERGRRFGGVKVFVCGFNGYAYFHDIPAHDLTRIRDNIVFVNVLDFDLDRAIRDYRRQDLFLLVPEPRGRDAFDSIHRKYPGIYEARANPRLFFGQDFIAPDQHRWRLFEIIKAPSEDLPENVGAIRGNDF